MPSTNRSRSSGFAWMRFDTSRSPSSNTSRQGESRIFSTSRIRPLKSSADRHITSAPKRSKNAAWRASSTSCVARNSSISPRGRRQQERREVGRHALLADVERAEAPDRGLLRLARRGHPLLLVDREVELGGLPVLALPEGVELAVVEQPAAVAHAALGVVAGVALAGAAHAAVHVQVRPLLLELALLLLALELGVVGALGARDPAPEQRDRVDLALDRGELVLHGLRGAHLPRGHALVGVERDGGGARHARDPRAAPRSPRAARRPARSRTRCHRPPPSPRTSP